MAFRQRHTPLTTRGHDMRQLHAPVRLAAIAGLLLMSGMTGPPDAAGSQADSPPSPPGQPRQGPGGRATTYERVQAEHVGEDATGYSLFVPEDVPSSDGPLPLVLFFHGFSAVDPTVYRAWIDHIVRRGAVVVYPDYQSLELDELNPDAYLPNALAAVTDALDRLEAPRYPEVDLSRVATVGHSVGGVLAANYAAVSGPLGLPVPRAMMPVEPGGCRGCGDAAAGLPLARLELVPAETFALVVVGSDDTIVGEGGALAIWEGTGQIPDERRDYVEIVSDARGEPALLADHFQPSAHDMGGEVDALDWYGTWKLFDALMACAFAGELCGSALGNTPEQVAMGTWSDGVPVTPLRVTDAPSGQ